MDTYGLRHFSLAREADNTEQRQNPFPIFCYAQSPFLSKLCFKFFDCSYVLIRKIANSCIEWSWALNDLVGFFFGFFFFFSNMILVLHCQMSGQYHGKLFGEILRLSTLRIFLHKCHFLNFLPCGQEILQMSSVYRTVLCAGGLGETSNLGQSPSDSIDDTVFSSI